MKRYYIVGSYDDVTPQTVEQENSVNVIIPLMIENKLQHGIGNYLYDLNQVGIYPDEDGIDILCLAALIYLADTRISRDKHSQDSWTREISITLPVFNVEKWKSQKGVFAKMLTYLTGDKWDVSFVKRDISLMACEQRIQLSNFDAATLFSGGMDSLIGTINNLECGKKVALISHAADGYTKNVQTTLLSRFNSQYSSNSPQYINLWMSYEQNIIQNGGEENTTRSRSFLFIASGVCAVSGMEGVSVLSVPENALIALNIALDKLRVGSHSTHTTHPFYLALWNEVLSGLEMNISVNNPYWNKTKGEMAVECLNKEFLKSVLPISISCSSPLKARWKGNAPQHCGYCVPCIIRRAAISKAFGINNDLTPYSQNDLRIIISNHAKNEGIQLRSFQVAIERVKNSPQLAQFLIHKGGPLDNSSEYLTELSDVYLRGLLEVDSFIQQNTSQNQTTEDVQNATI